MLLLEPSGSLEPKAEFQQLHGLNPEAYIDATKEDYTSLFAESASLKEPEGMMHPVGERHARMVQAPGIREPQIPKLPDLHTEAPKVSPVPSMEFWSQPAAFPYCSTQGSSSSFVQRERACSHRFRASGGLVRLM